MLMTFRSSHLPSRSAGICLIHLIIFGAVRAHSETLPEIPGSSRVITFPQVRNFWIRALQAKPVPPKPNGLHPDRQSTWSRALADRNATIEAIRNGDHDTEALLVLHSHNAAAWRLSGNEEAAMAEEATLRELREHLARMHTLEFLARAAQSQIDSAERLRNIEAELESLRATLHHIANNQ
jgi:hypothetical protein